MQKPTPPPPPYLTQTHTHARSTIMSMSPPPSWPRHEHAMWRSIPSGTLTLAVPALPRLATANWKDQENSRDSKCTASLHVSKCVRARFDVYYRKQMKNNRKT